MKTEMKRRKLMHSRRRLSGEAFDLSTPSGVNKRAQYGSPANHNGPSHRKLCDMRRVGIA